MDSLSLGWLWMAVSFLWIVVYAAAAAAAFWRFRTKLPGILIGGAFALLAVKVVGLQLLQRFAFAERAYDDPTRLVTYTANWLLSAALLLAVAVGVALIPRALNRRG